MATFHDIPYPKDAPQVGDRVKTRCPIWGDIVTGVITEVRDGYSDIVDGERCTQDPWVCLRVDNVPPRWPYPDRDSFAPDLAAIEPLN